MTPAAPCTDDSPAHAGDSPDVVRTDSCSERNLPAAAYQTASKRFEVRLTVAQLDAWRAIAAQQGVSVADLVRVAVALAGELPPGHIRGILEREQADRLGAALAALESFHAADVKRPVDNHESEGRT